MSLQVSPTSVVIVYTWHAAGEPDLAELKRIKKVIRMLSRGGKQGTPPHEMHVAGDNDEEDTLLAEDAPARRGEGLRQT